MRWEGLKSRTCIIRREISFRKGAEYRRVIMEPATEMWNRYVTGGVVSSAIDHWKAQNLEGGKRGLHRFCVRM